MNEATMTQYRLLGPNNEMAVFTVNTGSTKFIYEVTVTLHCGEVKSFSTKDEARQFWRELKALGYFRPYIDEGGGTWFAKAGVDRYNK